MDRIESKLTPTKITKLLQLAEAATPVPLLERCRRRVLAEKNVDEATRTNNDSGLQASSGDYSKLNTPSESTGILDLDQLQGFGESLDVGDKFSFRVGEMTGRSTESEMSRAHDSGVERLAERMRQQSCDVADIVRQSICSDYTFSCNQPDLSQAEMSFVRERGDLPVMQSQMNLNLTKCSKATDTTADMSVGSYFMKGSHNLAEMIGRCDSPRYDLSLAQSIIDGDSRMYGAQPGFTTINDSDCVALDNTLDHVPTRQRPSNRNATFTAPRPPAGTSEKLANATYTAKPGVGNRTYTTEPSVGRNQKIATALKAPMLQHLVTGGSNVTQEDSSLAADSSLSLSLIAKCLGKIDSDITPSMLITEAKKKNKKTDAESSNQQNATLAVSNHQNNIQSNAAHLSYVLKEPSKNSYENKENIDAFATSKPESFKGSTSNNQSKSVADKFVSAGNSCCESSKTGTTVQENRISTSNGSGDNTLTDSICVDSWLAIETPQVVGYVGASEMATIKLTSSSETLMYARLRLDESVPDNGSLEVDIPRLPVLLTPSTPGVFNVRITAFRPIDDNVTLSLLLQDTSEDVEFKRELKVKVQFSVPKVEIFSLDGTEFFASTGLGCETFKSYIVVNEFSGSLQLVLTLSQNVPVFSIGLVEQIRAEEIQRCLNDAACGGEGLRAEVKGRKLKYGCKQVCVLNEGCALRVILVCSAPKSIGNETKVSFKGSLNIHLFGTETLLQSAPLGVSIGTTRLCFQHTGESVLLSKEHQTLEVKNAGSIGGAWKVSVRGTDSHHFAVSPNVLELPSGAVGAVHIDHVKQNTPLQCSLVLENISDGKELTAQLIAPPDKPTAFPIKTTHSEIAWVKEGRRELSLKNASEGRVTAKCCIHGEGYFIENHAEASGDAVIRFEPGQCISLTILYKPKAKGAHRAKLAISLEDDSRSVKTVWLHGSAGGGGPARWSRGMLVCGDGGILLARRCADNVLAVDNPAHHPAFYSARLIFNLQYKSLSTGCRVSPARGVIPPGGCARLTLQLDWSRLERLGHAVNSLASVMVMVGPEIVRRRILRILDKFPECESLLSQSVEPSRLKGAFAGEDPAGDVVIGDFSETRRSLPTLVGCLQELTAHVELAREPSAERSVIVLADETCVQHHTLID